MNIREKIKRADRKSYEWDLLTSTLVYYILKRDEILLEGNELDKKRIPEYFQLTEGRDRMISEIKDYLEKPKKRKEKEPDRLTCEAMNYYGIFLMGGILIMIAVLTHIIKFF